MHSIADDNIGTYPQSIIPLQLLRHPVHHLHFGCFSRGITFVVGFLRVSSSQSLLLEPFVVLHVEGERLHVRHRAHSSHAAIHRPFDVLQRLTLGLRHAEDHEEQGREHDHGKSPEGAVG